MYGNPADFWEEIKDFEEKINNTVLELQKSTQKETIKSNLIQLMNLMIGKLLHEIRGPDLIFHPTLPLDDEWFEKLKSNEIYTDWFGSDRKDMDYLKRIVKRMLELKVGKYLKNIKDWPVFVECCGEGGEEHEHSHQASFLIGKLQGRFGDALRSLGYEFIFGEDGTSYYFLKDSELFREATRLSIDKEMLTRYLFALSVGKGDGREWDQIDFDWEVDFPDEIIEMVKRTIYDESSYALFYGLQKQIADAALDIIVDDILKK